MRIDLSEVSQALFLLNLPGHYYTVEYWDANPRLWSAIVTRARIHHNRLTIHTNRGDLNIQLVPPIKFSLWSDGTIQVLPRASSRPFLKLITLQIDDAFRKAIATANSCLGRPPYAPANQLENR